MILGAEPSSITLTNLVTDFEIEPRPATNILSLELLIEELEERLILDASDEKLEVAKNFKALHKIVNCLGIKGPLGLVGKAAEERTIEVVIHECTRVWNDHQVKDLLKNLGRVCTRYLIPPLGGKIEQCSCSGGGTFVHSENQSFQILRSRKKVSVNP